MGYHDIKWYMSFIQLEIVILNLPLQVKHSQKVFIYEIYPFIED